MNVTNFIVENEFLKKYGFLSSYTLSDGHGINPAWVEENSKNTELIFIDAVSNSNIFLSELSVIFFKKSCLSFDNKYF